MLFSSTNGWNQSINDFNDLSGRIRCLETQYLKEPNEPNDTNIPNEKLIQRYKILRYISKLNLLADRIEKKSERDFVLKKLCRDDQLLIHSH